MDYSEEVRDTRRRFGIHYRHCDISDNYALTADRIDVLAEFLGVLLGFLLAYVATEGVQCLHAQNESDRTLADVQVELEQVVVTLSDPEAYYSVASAKGSTIESQGLTYVIPRDTRKRVLDAYTTIETCNSLSNDYTECLHGSDCDADCLDHLANSQIG